MKRILITKALVATLFVALPAIPAAVAQKPQAPKRNLKVDVRYDKKKDVTTLRLEPLVIWEGGFAVPRDSMYMLVAFEYPKRTIVKPQEVWIHFDGGSGGDWEPFPTPNFAAVVDGVRLDLGTFEGGRGALIRSVPRGGIVIERRRQKVSFDNFAKIASARKLTLVIGDHDYDIATEHLQALNYFYQLMQQEGREIH